MKVVLISPTDRRESEIPFLLKMFEEGLPTYHLRKTKFSTRELKNFIEQIPEKYHPRLVIHTHHTLAAKFRLKGIYISRTHKKRKYRTWFRMQYLKFKKRGDLEVSTTFRSIEDILDYNSRYDYVFISPVFDSVSGNFQAGFSANNLKLSLRQTKYQVVARGGIAVDTIQKAHDLGFAGIALYSGIWKAPFPTQEWARVVQKFNELKIPME